MSRDSRIILFFMLFADAVIGGFMYGCWIGHETALEALMGVTLGTFLVITWLAASDLE